MIAVSCTLISKEYQKDESGNIVVENGKEKYTNVYIEVPIIDVQSVWKNEFYKANEQGLRPSIRIVISVLNFNDEKELIYMNNNYSNDDKKIEDIKNGKITYLYIKTNKNRILVVNSINEAIAVYVKENDRLKFVRGLF